MDVGLEAHVLIGSITYISGTEGVQNRETVSNVTFLKALLDCVWGSVYCGGHYLT